MRLFRRVLAALLCGLVLTTLAASPASAHATLTSVDPADGARLDASPDVVRLTFSERVSADLGGVRVLDAEGAQVQEGTARVDGTSVEVGLAPNLPDGTYVISYRVTSADGHPIRGGSVFAVGDVDVDTAALGRVTDDGSDRTWEIVGAVGRGLAYAGVLLAAGGVAFLVLVHRGGAERGRLVRVICGASLVGAAGTLVALPVQAALGTGQGPGSLFDDGVLAQVAGDGVGAGVLLALVGLIVAIGALDWNRWVALSGAVVGAASFAASGHTRAGSSAALATLADISHLVVVAAWGAGMLLLWLTLRHRRRAGDDDASGTAALVGRFSTLATVTVVAVGVTGSALAWTQVRSLDGLTGTGYGRLLLVKVAVVIAIGALGAYNHFRLVPALTRGKAKAAMTQLRATLRVEAMALVAVVALSAVLVVVTPARTEAEGGLIEETVSLGNAGSVQITVSPAKAGFNQIHLYLFDPDGRPAEIAESVTLVLSLPAAQLGPLEREATRAGPAHLQLDGNDLAVGGTWTIEVRARIDRFTEATGEIEVPIAD